MILRKEGRNLGDFGVQFFNLPVSDFLKQLNGSGVSIKLPSDASIQPVRQSQDNNHINILSATDINSYSLLKYLQERKIGNEIAAKYLKEVGYEIGEKIYYALGFKNDAGGYELRNEYFKGSSSPKDIKLIDNGSNN